MFSNLFKVPLPVGGRARTVNPAISLQTAEPTLGHGVVVGSRSTQVRDSARSFSKTAEMDERNSWQFLGDLISTRPLSQPVIQSKG